MLTQLEPTGSCPVACYLREKNNTHLTKTIQVVTEINKHHYSAYWRLFCFSLKWSFFPFCYLWTPQIFHSTGKQGHLPREVCVPSFSGDSHCWVKAVLKEKKSETCNILKFICVWKNIFHDFTVFWLWMFWGDDKIICDKSVVVPWSNSFYKARLSIILWRNRNGTLNLPYLKDCGFSGLGDNFENSIFVFGPRYSPGDCRWFGLLVCFNGFFW